MGHLLKRFRKSAHLQVELQRVTVTLLIFVVLKLLLKYGEVKPHPQRTMTNGQTEIAIWLTSGCTDRNCH